MQLLPCPFCGQPFQDCSFDRGVLFKCNSCNYSRSFPGILQIINNGVSCGNGSEYYHADAKDKAIEEMNKRAGVNEDPFCQCKEPEAIYRSRSEGGKGGYQCNVCGKEVKL